MKSLTFDLCENIKKNSALIIIFVFITYFSIGLLIFSDYGFSWDEETDRITGFVSLKYISEQIGIDLLQDKKLFNSIPSLKEYKDRDYGVIFQLPAVLLERILQIQESKNVYLFRHFLIFVLFFISTIYFYRILNNRFTNKSVAILGVLFLILTPRIFAHSFYNSKDIVFLSLFIISLFYSITYLKKPSIANSIYLAIITAMLICSRLMGVVIPVVIGTIMVLRLIFKAWPPQVIISFSLYLFISCILTVTFWPYLWEAPLENFVTAFKNMAHFRHEINVLYRGELIKSTALPWHYIPVWILITTPILYLILFIAGILKITEKTIKNHLLFWKNHEDTEDIFIITLLLGSILSVIVLGSVLYDGWRQLYYVYPLFIIISVIGWDWIYRANFIQRYIAPWPLIFLSITFLFLLSTYSWMVKAHPYQNVYFNIFAGKNIISKYDMDYWGLGTRKAIEHILRTDIRPNIKLVSGGNTPLRQTLNMLEEIDKKRVSILPIAKGMHANYVLTIHRDSKLNWGPNGYGLLPFYQIYVSGELMYSVYFQQ